MLFSVREKWAGILPGTLFLQVDTFIRDLCYDHYSSFQYLSNGDKVKELGKFWKLIMLWTNLREMSLKHEYLESQS